MLRSALVLVAVALLAGGGGAGAGERALPRCSFEEIHGPGGAGALYGVDARRGDDVWLVGGRGGDLQPGRAFVEHWNGRALRLVPSVRLAVGASGLFAVAAVSPRDAWAVGFDHASPLIERWNGIRWSRVAAPVATGVLFAVAARSASDVWAVGSRASADDVAESGRGAPLVLHWNGERWTPRPDPPMGPVYDAAIGHGGMYVSGSGVARWTGGRWQALKGVGFDWMGGRIAVLSSGELWAAGGNLWRSRNDRREVVRKEVTYSRDGEDHGLSYRVVRADGRGRVWVVAESFASQPEQRWSTIYAFDGSRSTRVPSPSRYVSDAIYDVAAAPTGAVWAVGVVDVLGGDPTPTAAVCR